MTHTELVKALAKKGSDVASDLTPLTAHLWHMVTGISGEAGELLDAIKKVAIYGKEIDHKLFEHVIEELGDLEFYMEGLRQGLNISREEVLESNIAKLTKRYGETYSNEAAINRVDKD